MTPRSTDEVRTMVREHYGNVAKANGCGSGCCGPNPEAALQIGYAPEDLASVPEGTNMGLGCGNPQAIALLRTGETVLDLGSGGGFDCFLAGRQVGPSGHVIGVDMTAEMITKARANAERIDAQNVEFRLGEIEHLPVADATVGCARSSHRLPSESRRSESLRKMRLAACADSRLTIVPTHTSLQRT